jgi:TRAP-type C4-dicarboxylate transport system substrate-binding protein
MKRIAAMLFAIAAFALAGPAAAQTKLKWAHVYEGSEPYHKQALWAADEIAKRTKGRYAIEVFPASTLGKETDINQGLTLGTVDIIYTGQLFAGRTYGPIAIGGAPYMFRDFTLTYYGERHVTSNKAINKPEDMKGLKIRVPDAPLYMMFPKAVGANPTPIAFAEVYLALQNGTVDAQENPLPTIDAKKFYEVQKYIILTGHIIDSLATQVAPHVWTKLSDPEKKIFTEVTQEAAAKATAEIQKREGELVDEFRKKGLTVTAVDKKSFQDAILKNVTFESMGYSKADWDKIQAIK